IQELEEKLRASESPNEKIDLLNELAEKTRTTDFSGSIRYSKDAVELAEKSADKKGMSKSYWNHGINLRLNSQYNEAFEYLEKGLKISKETGDISGEAAILNSIANIHANSGNYQKAIEYLNSSIGLLRQINHKDLEASVLSNYGAIYHEMGDYSIALEYYLKSSLIYKEHSKDIPENLLNNIGEVYKMLGDYDTALEYYLKSLKLAREKNNKPDESFALLNISLVYGSIKDYDKALIYLGESSQLLKELGYKQSEHITANIKDNFSGLSETDRGLDFYFRVLTLRDDISDMTGKAQTLSTIGNIYFSSGKYQLAEKYFMESLKLSVDLGDKLNQVKNYLYLGILNNKMHETGPGFNYMKKALELAENINAKKDIYEIHRAMYEGYKTSGELSKALEHLEKAYSVEKDVFNIESDKKLSNLSLKYESESAEKEKKIALQEKEIFRLKNVELASANDKLKFLNEEKNDFMGIAAHDLKNPLSGILSFSKKIQKFEDNDLPAEQVMDYGKEIEKASEKMFEMITKMLDVTAIESGKRNINAETFEVTVLAQRVKLDYYQKAEQKQIEVVFNEPEKINVNLDKMALRQILDNVLSNAIKFSPQGKKIYFRIIPQKDSVIFSIKDEGPGLTEKDKTKLFGKFTRLSAQPTGGENSTGLGLSIAKKLSEAMKGKIWAESEEGKGAEFFIELPLDLNL
ncbi:MAG: tetratricopeptide repeat protein, partial [Ignavibacteria bacterium]